MSNTMQPVPDLWPGSAFAPLVDVPVFSCVEGLRKPDQRIYLLACSRLGVAPEEALFVGDGTDHELGGAVKAGMRAVQCCVPGGDPDGTPFFRRQDWAGARIEAFSDLLGLLRMRE